MSVSRVGFAFVAVCLLCGCFSAVEARSSEMIGRHLLKIQDNPEAMKMCKKEGFHDFKELIQMLRDLEEYLTWAETFVNKTLAEGGSECALLGLGEEEDEGTDTQADADAASEEGAGDSATGGDRRLLVIGDDDDDDDDGFPLLRRRRERFFRRGSGAARASRDILANL